VRAAACCALGTLVDPAGAAGVGGIIIKTPSALTDRSAHLDRIAFALCPMIEDANYLVWHSLSFVDCVLV
jgi:hypothetical protein